MEEHIDINIILEKKDTNVFSHQLILNNTVCNFLDSTPEFGILRSIKGWFLRVPLLHVNV